MKVSVMQPYFFPYIGYFSLINESNVFIACDEVQHIKQGWGNRNRVCSLDKEFNYIRINLAKASQNSLIKEITIQDNDNWKNILINQLQIYQKCAPYYNDTIKLINCCFEYKENNLAKWNVNSLRIICDYLGIKTQIQLLTEMDLIYEKPQSADEWGLYITKALNGKEYINLPGGRSFYDKGKYEALGINIRFIKNRLTPYKQISSTFTPGLSIIDTLMFNSVAETNILINEFDLLEGLYEHNRD